MAASPAPTTTTTNSNNSAATASPAASAAAASSPAKTGTLALAANRTETPPTKSQRGQNKPKCRQCGNVARSRCPYESCKSCCSRNQNPCHIHVLKANSTTSEKTPSSGATPPDQQSSEPSQSQSTAGRVASLRQLSNSFAQFNNLHISLRSRKPLTRKDAAAINEWRFSRLKEYKERSIEAETEAFDRYMQNVSLLEEVLSVKDVDDNLPSSSESNPTPIENNETMIPGLKLQLRSNSTRSDRLQKRIQQIVDEGLKKLQNCAVVSEIDEPVDEEADKASKRVKRTERLSTTSDLIDKINKARSDEDLKSCSEMKFQLFSSDEGSDMIRLQDDKTHMNQTAENDASPAKESDYSLQKSVRTAEIDQETLNTIDKHFSSNEHVKEL